MKLGKHSFISQFLIYPRMFIRLICLSITMKHKFTFDSWKWVKVKRLQLKLTFYFSDKVHFNSYEWANFINVRFQQEGFD